MSIEPKHLTIKRRVRYAVLEAPEPPVTEVWFVLHGYKQLAHRFLRYFESISEGGRMVVAAEGLHRQYIDHAARKIGASWMTSEDRLTDIEDYVAYLDRLAEHTLGEAQAEGARKVALGFSQGVHTLCRWLAFGSTPIDRAILWGETIPPDLDLETYGEKLGGMDLQLVVGDSDEYFNEQRIAAHEGRLREHGMPFTGHSYEGGHRISREMLQRLGS